MSYVARIELLISSSSVVIFIVDEYFYSDEFLFSISFLLKQISPH